MNTPLHFANLSRLNISYYKDAHVQHDFSNQLILKIKIFTNKMKRSISRFMVCLSELKSWMRMLCVLIRCTVYYVQSKVYTVQCTPLPVQCAVFILHFTV